MIKNLLLLALTFSFFSQSIAMEGCFKPLLATSIYEPYEDDDDDDDYFPPNEEMYNLY